jgi:hypothetical protein
MAVRSVARLGFEEIVTPDNGPPGRAGGQSDGMLTGPSQSGHDLSSIDPGTIADERPLAYLSPAIGIAANRAREVGNARSTLAR